MLGPSAFFRFVHVVGTGSAQRRFAVAYKPPGPAFAGAVEQLVLDVCKGPILPDALVVLTLQEEGQDGFLQELDKDSSKIARERLHGRIPLLHAHYSVRSGKLRSKLLDRSFRGRISELKLEEVSNAPDVFRSGLLGLFRQDIVILTAPPGYEYQKPSGSRARFFLKPDLALTSSASVAFVSLAVFHKLFAGKLERVRDLCTAFVDTMAISPVAYGLRDLLGLLGNQPPLLIESFHSYGGFEEVRRPLSGTSICLISASTSMALHERWIAEKGATHDEVLTLLTLNPVARFAEGALLAIDAPEHLVSGGPPQLSIHIRGENFLPEQEPPKRILLTDKFHRSDRDVSHFRAFAGAGIFDVFRRPPRPMSKVRAIFIDGDQLIRHEEFEKWLVPQLQQRAKAATRFVVFQDDPSSHAFATRIKGICEQELSLAALQLVNARELSTVQMKSQDGVIVCAGVVGKGSQLLEVSRSLRDKHEGARLYLVGYQVAETQAQLKALPDHLRHSKGVVPHDFEAFGKVAIGTQLGEFYRAEQSTYYASSVDEGTLLPALRARSAALGEPAAVGSMALMPHGARLQDRLQLRTGFAYWADGYTAQPCQPELLATIGVLLQRAREGSDVPEERRLASRSFRQVMLHPENFARFNDGIVQAALLRNAYPSELDYRSDEASSAFMMALIERALAKAEEEAGEGALEFLLALSLRRLQLMPSHLAEVLKSAQAMSGKSQQLSRAIRFVLAPLMSKPRKRREKLPF